jgi:hypothetical protein
MWYLFTLEQNAHTMIEEIPESFLKYIDQSLGVVTLPVLSRLTNKFEVVVRVDATLVSESALLPFPGRPGAWHIVLRCQKSEGAALENVAIQFVHLVLSDHNVETETQYTEPIRKLVRKHAARLIEEEALFFKALLPKEQAALS